MYSYYVLDAYDSHHLYIYSFYVYFFKTYIYYVLQFSFLTPFLTFLFTAGLYTFTSETKMTRPHLRQRTENQQKLESCEFVNLQIFWNSQNMTFSRKNIFFKNCSGPEGARNSILKKKHT